MKPSTRMASSPEQIQAGNQLPRDIKLAPSTKPMSRAATIFWSLIAGAWLAILAMGYLVDCIPVPG